MVEGRGTLTLNERRERSHRYMPVRIEWMGSDILVAMIALIGTMFGTFGGILTSSKLTNYRIEQLEKKVAKHNNFAERIPVLEEQIKVCEHRIGDLEHEGRLES